MSPPDLSGNSIWLDTSVREAGGTIRRKKNNNVASSVAGASERRGSMDIADLAPAGESQRLCPHASIFNFGACGMREIWYHAFLATHHLIESYRDSEIVGHIMRCQEQAHRVFRFLEYHLIWTKTQPNTTWCMVSSFF